MTGPCPTCGYSSELADITCPRCGTTRFHGPPETITIPRTQLQTIFDMICNCVNMSSGFMDEEDVVAARSVAVLLGADPMEATPEGVQKRYPHKFKTKMGLPSNRCFWCGLGETDSPHIDDEGNPIKPIYCAHCGRTTRNYEGGWAGTSEVPLCHPNEGGRPDCYRLVTIHGHVQKNCAACRIGNPPK